MAIAGLALRLRHRGIIDEAGRGANGRRTANIRRERGNFKKDVHRATAGLRFTAIMLRHKCSKR
jgi:hypothetical protein